MKFFNNSQSTVIAGSITFQIGVSTEISGFTLDTTTLKALGQALQNGSLVAQDSDAKKFIGLNNLSPALFNLPENNSSADGLVPAMLQLDMTGNTLGIAGADGTLVMERRPVRNKKNFVSVVPTVLDNMDAAKSGILNWVAYQGAGTSVENDASNPLQRIGATNTLKVIILSSFASITRQLKAPIVLNAGVVGVYLRISEMPYNYNVTPATLLTVGVDVYFGDATFTNSAVFSFTSAQFLRQGLNHLLINSADLGTLNSTGIGISYAGTGSSSSSFTHCKIVFSNLQPQNGITPIVNICGITQGGKAQAKIIMNLDDGQSDSLDLVSLFMSRGIPVSLGLVTGQIGTADHLTLSQLKLLESRGVELFAHTTKHVVMTTLSLADAKADMAESRNYMIRNGLLSAPNVFAFPQNNANDRLQAAAKDIGFSIARWSVPRWTPTCTGLDNPMAIGSGDLGNKTLAQAKLLVDSAESYGVTQIIYGHVIFTKLVQSMTHSAGVITVASTSHGYSNGNLVHHRGADQAEYNIGGVIENVTANTYTFKVSPNMVAPSATTLGVLKSFSPDFPAAGGAPPASSVLWNYSDYVAFADYVAARAKVGALDAINFSTLLDNCTETF